METGLLQRSQNSRAVLQVLNTLSLCLKKSKNQGDLKTNLQALSGWTANTVMKGGACLTKVICNMEIQSNLMMSILGADTDLLEQTKYNIQVKG